MTVYDIPNIEHCTITTMLNGTMYKIVASEGYYIHLNDGDEETANDWKGIAILSVNYDFSQVEIRAAADLPEGAEICADTTDTEVM